MLNEPVAHFVEASFFLFFQRKRGFVHGICLFLQVTGVFKIKLNQE